jgi:hypothetical protein
MVVTKRRPATQISRHTALRLGDAAPAAGFIGLAAAAETVVTTTYPGGFEASLHARVAAVSGVIVLITLVGMLLAERPFGLAENVQEGR